MQTVLELLVLAMREHQLAAQLAHDVQRDRRILRQQPEKHLATDPQHYHLAVCTYGGRPRRVREHPELAEQLVGHERAHDHLAALGVGVDIGLSFHDHERAVGRVTLVNYDLAV